MLSILDSAEYNTWFWSILAIIFIIAEVMFGGGALLLLVPGVSALAVSIALIGQVLPQEEFLWQGTFFLSMAVCLFAVLGFKLRKKWQSVKGYKNFIGQEAKIIENDLLPKKVGKISWSGTACRAMLADGERQLQVGDNVVIAEIKDNVFIVKSGR